MIIHLRQTRVKVLVDVVLFIVAAETRPQRMLHPQLILRAQRRHNIVADPG